MSREVLAHVASQSRPFLGVLGGSGSRAALRGQEAVLVPDSEPRGGLSQVDSPLVALSTWGVRGENGLSLLMKDFPSPATPLPFKK